MSGDEEEEGRRKEEGGRRKEEDVMTSKNLKTLPWQVGKNILLFGFIFQRKDGHRLLDMCLDEIYPYFVIYVNQKWFSRKAIVLRRATILTKRLSRQRRSKIKDFWEAWSRWHFRSFRTIVLLRFIVFIEILKMRVDYGLVTGIKWTSAVLLGKVTILWVSLLKAFGAMSLCFACNFTASFQYPLKNPRFFFIAFQCALGTWNQRAFGFLGHIGNIGVLIS